MKQIEEKDLQMVLDFCLELKAQDAKMSFTDYDTMEKLISLMKDPNVFIYISQEHQIVTAMFRAQRGEKNKTHSVDIACAVKSSHRNLHLATDITLYALEHLKTQGVLIARTKIYSWNEPSIKTIKKCGFVESGKIFMHQFEPCVNKYIDDLIFHKVL